MQLTHNGAGPCTACTRNTQITLAWYCSTQKVADGQQQAKIKNKFKRPEFISQQQKIEEHRQKINGQAQADEETESEDPEEAPSTSGEASSSSSSLVCRQHSFGCQALPRLKAFLQHKSRSHCLADSLLGYTFHVSTNWLVNNQQQQLVQPAPISMAGVNMHHNRKCCCKGLIMLCTISTRWHCHLALGWRPLQSCNPAPLAMCVQVVTRMGVQERPSSRSQTRSRRLVARTRTRIRLVSKVAIRTRCTRGCLRRPSRRSSKRRKRCESPWHGVCSVHVARHGLAASGKLQPTPVWPGIPECKLCTVLLAWCSWWRGPRLHYLMPCYPHAQHAHLCTCIICVSYKQYW